MNITSYPQFHLYLLTLHLMLIKSQLLPQNCDERCVNATIINMAYYSAYLYCVLWLEEVEGFFLLDQWEFDDDEEKISKHKQVRNALNDLNYNNLGSSLQDLFNLRFKADYEPFIDITSREVSDAIKHMEKIISTLKFE